MHRTLQQRQLVRNWCEVLERPGVNVLKDHTVAQLVEKGIPPLLRQRVWPVLIGNGQKITPETFALCVSLLLFIPSYRSRALSSSIHGSGGSAGNGGAGQRGKEETIRLVNEDLKRTFVPLGFFGLGEPLFEKIREVLLAYAYYRPDVGYVQGMSLLAGILAVHIPESALCFQCLCNMLGSEHLYAFYSLKVNAG